MLIERFQEIRLINKIGKQESKRSAPYMKLLVEGSEKAKGLFRRDS